MQINSSALIVNRKSSFCSFFTILSAALTLLALTACGGGGGGTSGGGGGGGGQVVSIAISPTTANLVVTQNKTFTATVSNSSNTAVTWAVQEGSSGGTITSAGVYTAPSQAGTYHVVATAQADTTKSASAAVTVAAAPEPTFTSTAPTSASQGTELAYTVTATDPAGGSVTFQLTTAPTGATLTGSTLKWTPTAAQSRIANSFTITARTSEGGSKTQSFSISPTGTISINRIVTYHTTDISGAFQTTSVPDDSTSPIAALVPDGHGGFTTIAGTNSTGGNYSIPNVPAGYFWLQHGPASYFWTQKSSIDSGFDFNRAASVSVGGLGTSLSLSMSGSSAWQANDAAIFYAPNTGIYQSFFSAGTAGSTTLTDTLDFKNQPLMDTSNGDAAFVYHMVHHVGGYQSVDQFFAYAPPPAFSITTGITNNLSGALANVTLDKTVRASVNASQFAAFTPAMGPGATDSSTCQGLEALPSTAETGYTGVSGDVVLVDDCASGVPVITDTDLGDVSYGDPYPSGWPLFSKFVHNVQVPYQLSGTTGPYNAVASNIVYNTTLPTAANPIVPLVGPVGSPTIAASASSTAANLLSDVTGVGTTPIISWQAPTVGTPTLYVITITNLVKLGVTVPFTSVSLYVGGNVHSIQVPPGAMSSGETYYIDISSRIVIGTGGLPVDPESHPFRRGVPYAQSDVLSGLVTP